jgi:hypothetical protein
MISADPVPVGEDSVWILPPQECEMMDHINVEGQGNTFSAYIARPKTSPTSAVVVLQELFGVGSLGSWEVGKLGSWEVWEVWEVLGTGSWKLEVLGSFGGKFWGRTE